MRDYEGAYQEVLKRLQGGDGEVTQEGLEGILYSVLLGEEPAGGWEAAVVAGVADKATQLVQGLIEDGVLEPLDALADTS
jgi:hypothetical protein